jgi:hypothetical protein
MSELERPKRLSLSQIVEMLLSRHAGERSSVKLSRSASGDTHIEVAVRTGDDSETQTVEQAETKAVEVYDRLLELYPPSEAPEDGSVTLTRNAKGETQIAVDVKTSPLGAPTVLDAEQQATEIYERERARFPLADGHVGAQPKRGK